METASNITLVIDPTALLIGMCVFFFALLAVIWKGKSEMTETLQQGLEPLTETIDKLKTNVKVVSDFLITSSTSFEHGRLQAYSPLRLTPAGNTYLAESKFIEVFSEYEAEFMEYVDREHPSNDYDIENASIRAVIQLFQKDYFAPVKDYLYNHPNEDKKSFFQTAGIYVRDKFMARQAEASSASAAPAATP